MVRKRTFFGTDGIRGCANKHPMDAETCLKLGMAAGAYFRNGEHRHRVVIGKDTRLSGYLIEPALTSGFISMGMDVTLVGPMPTPAVAMITRSLRADLGVMISASHNPYEDNGVKLFAPDGQKLSDATEHEIETLMQTDLTLKKVTSNKLGRAMRLDDAVGRYIEYVKQTFPKKLRLDGMKIVVDCAHGAAYKIAPTILWELGADVVAIGVKPDGLNINKACGSTHPETMCAAVKEHNAQIGIALDGDGDRLILCDENGALLDGDQLIAAIGGYWQKSGKLRGKGVVSTVMANLAFQEYLSSIGLDLIRTQVGDRYVIEAMRENHMNLGGEPSGHIIFRDYTTTGDGLVAALQALALLVETRKAASEALRVFTPYPQIMQKISCTHAPAAETIMRREIQQAILDQEKSMDKNARLLVRPSGTEPVIRVMVEGPDKAEMERIANALSDAIHQYA